MPIEQHFESGYIDEYKIVEHEDGKGSYAQAIYLVDDSRFNPIGRSAGIPLSPQELMDGLIGTGNWEFKETVEKDKGKPTHILKRIKNRRYIRTELFMEDEEFENMKTMYSGDGSYTPNSIRVPVYHPKVWENEMEWARKVLLSRDIIDAQTRPNPSNYDKIIIERWNPLWFLLFKNVVRWLGLK